MQHELSPPLAALVRALAPSGSSALDPGVPAELWRRALSGPAAEFLARPGKQLRSTIVRAGWLLGGGAPDALPANLPLVLELLHAGSLIIDDVEDGSLRRRGRPTLHQIVGVPLAINTGSWMYFWALAELGELGLPVEVELRAHRATALALVRCHQGQALDLATRVGELDAVHVSGVVEAATRLKTGTLCRLAAELGAIAAGAASARVEAVGAFAESMGIGLQMLDDLGSIASPARRDKGREDLYAGRATWPWAWLADLDPLAWRRLAKASRALVDIPGAEAACDTLAADLAAATSATGRARIRAVLDAALDELVAAVGCSPAIDAVALELARMEGSYGC